MFLSKENDILLIHDFDKFDELALNKVDDLVEKPFPAISNKQNGKVGIEKNLLYSSTTKSKNNTLVTKETDKINETSNIVKNKNLNCHDIKANQTKLSKIFLEIRMEAMTKNKDDQQKLRKKENSPESHCSPELTLHKQKTFSLGHLLNIKTKTLDTMSSKEEESYIMIKDFQNDAMSKPMKKINTEWEKTLSNRNSISNFDTNTKAYKLSDLYDPLFNPLTSSKISSSMTYKQSKQNTNDFHSRVVSNFQKSEISSLNTPIISQNNLRSDTINPITRQIHQKNSSLNSNINSQSLQGNFISISNPIFRTELKIKQNKKCPSLSEKEKNKLLKIYRQGINLDQYLPSNTKKVTKNVKSNRPMTSLLLNQKVSQKYYEEKRNEELDISIENKFKKVTEVRTKSMKNNMEAMKKDIDINYEQLFQLANQENFSKEYQIYDNVIDFENDEQLKNLINKMTEKKLELRKEIDDIFIKQMHNQEITRKKDNAIRWRRCIITAAIHFKRLNLTIHEYYEGKHEPIKPLGNDGSREFIQAVKDGDYETVSKQLKENKFYVHDYDYVSFYLKYNIIKLIC